MGKTGRNGWTVTEVSIFSQAKFNTMKKLILSLVFALSSTFMLAQQGEVLTIVEQMPEFPGGTDGLLKYLQTNIHYPEDARQNAIEGTVYVRFVVTATGEITGAEILRSKGESLDQEALRVVNAMPLWQPGKQRGEAVSVQYNLPIRFTLAVPENTNTKNKKGK